MSPASSPSRTASSSSIPTRIPTRPPRACWRRSHRPRSGCAFIPIRAQRACARQSRLIAMWRPSKCSSATAPTRFWPTPFQALLKHEPPLLFPDITYSFYPVYCGLYGIAHDEVPLDAAMRIDISNYRRPSSAILLCNPNAPTGIALQRDAIASLLAEQPDRLVVVDEAYVDFGAESAVPLVARHDNLLVIQTFSKSRSLAGLRVGFAIGQRPLIEALERVKDSFNSYPLDCLAIAGAIAAIEDEGWFRDTRARIIASREILARDLGELGFEVLPSLANFVFARHRSRSGAGLTAALRQRGVLVRHFGKPRIENFLRITVGTEVECARLVEVLRGLI